ncbi:MULTISPECIES: PAAR-like domain-containing protein [unclassified Mesorhizobium]|uniref:PAAR-like domain-containing protein n=4 Tax=Mesorhizobium TaxID=68287 RepID=UPI001FE0AADE|nr:MULTISPECIES: PAAR-like domain-containing protein [unclassified Mesorhizobium]
MTVYANGLEVACKAQANQVIAAFPYVCFTPPQTPATPPGVPVPYPTFGMDSDTDNGTGTVKIGGKTITQKNKSYYTKCTGNEAGCAPKKNIITSVNTGKEYAHAWSGDVKMDGEPISRFTDISSNDHASPTAGGPPMPKVATATPATFKCSDLEIKPYKELECPEGYEKEHTVEVQFFTAEGVRDLTLDCCKDYDDKEAPCICMKAKWLAGEAAKAKAAGAPGKKVVGKKRKTPHNLKSADARNWLSNNSSGKLGDFTDTCVNSTVKNLDDPKIPPAVQAAATECLKTANMEYMKKAMNKSEKEVKDKKACHATCPKAKDQARLVQVAKKRLKKAAGGESVVVTAADVAPSKVSC